MRKSLYLIGLAALMSSVALAGSNTANLGATATITNNCTITTGPVGFGTYEPLSGALAKDATGTVTVACTSGLTGAVVTLGEGLNPHSGSSADVPLRQLISGSDLLTYKLYSNSGRTTVWGNSAGTGKAASTGTGTDEILTVYGRIDSGQNTAPAGNYSDTVIATVTF